MPDHEKELGSIIATTNTPILEKKSTAGKKTGTAVYIFFRWGYDTFHSVSQALQEKKNAMK